MMSLYEENLKILAKAYPQMDVLIEEAKQNLEPELKVIEEAALDGEKILKIEKENIVCYLNGKRNTREAAQIWAGEFSDLLSHTPVFMMGVGNPCYLQELMDKNENQITVLVYEPSLQIFLKFLEMVSLKEWMEKHVLVFWVKGLAGMDEKTLDGMMGSLIQYEKISHAGEIILPNYELLFPKEAVNFMRIIRDCAKSELIQYSTKKYFSAMAVKNMLSNAKYFYDGYKTTQLVEVVPKDIPGIVVAAGPSLNKNIQELKKAKGKAFIVAVDTAMKPLLDAGIVPDMFATVDGEKQVSLVARKKAKEIPLMAALGAASDLMDYHTGKKFFYNQGFVFADTILLKHKKIWGGVNTGGSVATNVFSLLHKLGLECIILVGQDLAYTGRKSHADGTFEEIMKEEDVSKFIMVDGNEEEKVPTTNILRVYLEWYEQHIKGIQEINENFRVINATEGGAKIKGAEVMTLKEAVARECRKEINIQEKLKKLPKMLNEKEQEWTLKYLLDIPKQFQKLGKDAEKAEKFYQKLDEICRKGNPDVKTYLDILKKIKKISKKMESNLMYQMIDMTMLEAQYIMREEQYIQEDTIEAEGKAMARKGMLYSQHVKRMSELFAEYVKDIYEDFFQEKLT